ncbi:HutD family protein [Pseudomonas sp. UBA4194]|uniref:HutD/Ves family protein n=1 Tax=Pseudomonas sp. UBA4194 TaxID=1947317 RepID=UPI0025E05DA1|nr:HutD family protein [Pseudomonas sp. UBA4194]
MTDSQLYLPEDYTAMPWKNGAGSTLEIVQRRSADDSGYDWRLSIAQIDADGPFSVFAGYRRIISVLQGDGMVLEVDGVPSEALGPFQPLIFDGGAQVHCRLLGSPIEDFNLIYRQDRVQASLRWVECQPAVVVGSKAGEVVFFNASAGPVGVTDARDGRRYKLAPRATLRCINASGQLQRYTLEGAAAHICIVEITL